MSAGKGDAPRPVSGPKYRQNFDQIFRKKNLVPPANICQHMPTDQPTAATQPHTKGDR